jgi:hypothetical protein
MSDEWICKHCGAQQTYGGIGRGARILWSGCKCEEPKLVSKIDGREGAYNPPESE